MLPQPTRLQDQAHPEALTQPPPPLPVTQLLQPLPRLQEQDPLDLATLAVPQAIPVLLQALLRHRDQDLLFLAALAATQALPLLLIILLAHTLLPAVAAALKGVKEQAGRREVKGKVTWDHPSVAVPVMTAVDMLKLLCQLLLWRT